MANEEKELRNAEQECYRYSIKLSNALQRLGRDASRILGYEVTAEICAGDEIEFRRVMDDGLSDSMSCIRIEEIIEQINKTTEENIEKK